MSNNKKTVLNRTQVKFGAILSYVLIVLNTLYGLVLSPYILTQLGSDEYGVYKTIASLSSSLMILDLGIGSTVMRYTAKFRAEKNQKAIGEFAAMGLIESAIIAVLFLLMGGSLFYGIDPMYSNTFSSNQLSTAKIIYIIMIINIIFVLFENVLNGVITGYNEFLFANGYKLIVLIFKMIATYLVLQIFKKAIALVLITLSINIINIIVQIIYIHFKLQIRIKLTKWDATLFKESLGYTTLMLLQTIAHQANGNIDNIVIGAVISVTSVAVYSFGIQIYTMFQTLATSFSGLMLPSISSKIADGASDEELQKIVTIVGRFQYAVLAPATIGFAIIGKEFIGLWLGKGFEDVYYLSLILIIPVILPLIQNVCLSILRARNKMGFRTVSLFITAVFNVAFTFIGTIFFGYFAAAIGTALATLFGWIMMNIYYKKHIGFKPVKFYKDVFKHITICAIIAGIIIWIVNYYIYGSWFAFILKVVLYIIIYAILMLKVGFSNEEKNLIKSKNGFKNQ